MGFILHLVQQFLNGSRFIIVNFGDVRSPGGTLLNINNDQNLEIENAIFPANTWGGLYNVTKSNNAGNVTFIGATGGFAGENFDNDPNNRIHWSELTNYLDVKVWLRDRLTIPT